MKSQTYKALWVAMALAVTMSTWMGLSQSLTARQASATLDNNQDMLLQGFAKIDPIDSHTHVYQDNPEFNAFLKRLNLHIMDIAVSDDRYPLTRQVKPEINDILGVVKSSKGNVSLCTTFSPYPFESPQFSQDAIQQLNKDFAEGAVAVKIYKTIGMEIKKKSGKYLMPDDPAFEPIYRDIAAHHRTIIAHIAEPTSCWKPPNPASPDYRYYQTHPHEYAYLHPEWPSKAAILAARDHMLAENPQLRVVGAHLGSMEVNVDDIAEHFDRYPNFAVDTAARVPYLELQPREKVRNFIIKYQDRILYGTDHELNRGDNTAETLKQWKEGYAHDWKYFATDDMIQYKGHDIRGLKLPPSVLRKLYHDNAVRWFPGILGTH